MDKMAVTRGCQGSFPVTTPVAASTSMTGGSANGKPAAIF